MHFFVFFQFQGSVAANPRLFPLPHESRSLTRGIFDWLLGKQDPSSVDSLVPVDDAGREQIFWLARFDYCFAAAKVFPIGETKGCGESRWRTTRLIIQKLFPFEIGWAEAGGSSLKT